MGLIKFISSQPDVPYFHWQCEIYGYNFQRLGIDPNDIVMLFGLQGDEPSDGLKNFPKNTMFIFTRIREIGNTIHPL